MQSQTLLNFCQIIGLEADEIKTFESPRRFSLLTKVPVLRLKATSEEAVQEMIDVFGSSLTLALGIDDVQPLIEIQMGNPTRLLADAISEINELPDEMEMRVRIQIEKQTLLQGIQYDLSQIDGLYFLFLENFVKLLNAPITKLDKEIFTDPHRPSVVFISDTDLIYKGSLLSIIGGVYIYRTNDLFPKPSHHVLNRIDNLHRLASEYINWVDFRIQFLTPIHLLFETIIDEDSNLSHVLSNRLLHLVIIYTANRSIVDNQILRAFFATSEQTFELLTDSNELVLHQVDEIVKLVAWFQSNFQPDKLTIFQNCVVRELIGDDPKNNFKIFLNRLPNILQQARWNYRIFIDSKITKHFEKVQDANNYVIGVSREISDELSTLTKGFVDTLLASVGVVILTLIASLAENNTQGMIFKFGMWVYAGYLLIFQVIYRMGNIYYNYKLINGEGEAQLVRYEAALGKTNLIEPRKYLAQRKHYFQSTFWITVGLYILVILLIIVLGYSLPSTISNLVAPTPTPIIP